MPVSMTDIQFIKFHFKLKKKMVNTVIPKYTMYFQGFKNENLMIKLMQRINQPHNIQTFKAIKTNFEDKNCSVT